MLAEIKFGWGAKIKKHEAEALAELSSQRLEDIMEQKKEDEPDDGTATLRSWTSHIVDLNDLAKIAPELKYEVVRTFKSRSSFVDVLDQFKEVADNLARLPFNQQQDFNAKVNVHVPNLGLLLMDETKLLEDSCTDNLQDHLDEGWRILAICPQPDQRRPDYILGRTKR